MVDKYARILDLYSKKILFFFLGDSRANEVPELITVHAIWHREHNRIADELARINPGWNDEILYQEARRILIAEMQHVTYSEFVPILIGRRMMKKFGLEPLKEGYSFNYREDLNPGILGAFSTAAFRFHSLVASWFELRTEDDKVVDRFRLSNTYFDPSLLYKRGAFDLLINGLVQQPTQKNDQYFSEEVGLHLFRPRGGSFGMDLAALNIQRGRDHGLPGYNKWRELCGLRRIQNFRDLANVMPQATAQSLSRLYGSVDDVDLYIAGIAENPIQGAIVGPTFACILAEQFRRLKEGDRLWYENGNTEFPLSPGNHLP